MTFDYGDYFRTDCVGPFILSGVGTVVYLIGCILLLINIAKGFSKKWLFLSIVIVLFITGLVFFLWKGNPSLYELFGIGWVLYMISLLASFMDKEIDFFERAPKLRTGVHALNSILVLLTGLFITVNSVRILSNGGVFLPYESEADAVSIQGVVKEATEMNLHVLSYQSANHIKGKGASVLVNEERFYMVSIGSIQVGDTIEILYLPKSHFSLCVRLLNSE